MSTRTPLPAPDLSYSVEDFDAHGRRDSQYLYRVLEDTMLALATEVQSRRVLDVACGTGKQPMRMAERGCYAVGAEASMEMIGVGRLVHPGSGAAMVRSVAESLPFADGTFDRVLCQGSLDHFADPGAFMREAARVVSAEGRVVIALANFESLACRIGRAVDRVKRALRRPRPPWRLYWQIPEDHTVKGDLAFVRRLGGDELELERCVGMSLLWNVTTYGWLLDKLPETAAERAWRLLDGVARRRPGQADMIISVWRRREGTWESRS